MDRYIDGVVDGIIDGRREIYNPVCFIGSREAVASVLDQIVAGYTQSYPDKKMLRIDGITYSQKLIQNVKENNLVEFRNHMKSCDLLIMESIEEIGGRQATMQEFYGLFDALYEHGGQIIIGSAKAPNEILSLEDRVRTQLESGIICNVGVKKDGGFSMTAQRGDIYKYNNNQYTCLSWSGGPRFNPRDYGFDPTAMDTACWRGFQCIYEITDFSLKLQELYIYDANGFYPEINGVSIIDPDYLPDEDEEIVDNDSASPHYIGPQTYHNLNLVIPFTGKLLLATDFIHDYYIHMGLQRPFGFKKLYSFEFEDGVLKQIVNHSVTAKMLRDLNYPDGKSRSVFVRDPYDKLPAEIRKTVWWA